MKKKIWKKENLTFPNVLSLLRILLIIPFVLSVIEDNYLRAGIVLIVSGLSDMLDGIIARKLGQVSELGKMLDPTADKLTLMSVMICVGIKFPEIFPFMIILIVKEIAMLAAGIILLQGGHVPPGAQWYGKSATVMFYISVITIIGLKAIWNLENQFANLFLMTATAFLMFYAVFKYLKIFVSMMEEDKKSG